MLARKMLFHQGLVTAPVKTPAEDYRLTTGGLWAPEGTDALKVRSGVVAGPGAPGFTACQVVAGGGQVTVKPGRVVVQGAAANQGHYEGTIDADQTRTVAAATIGAGLPAAGQFKAGRVVVRVYDQLYDGGAVDGWDVEVHLGSSAASAGAAGLPPVVGNSFTLRTFTVDSAGAITLGGATPYTAPGGGRLPVTAATRPAAPFDGLRIEETDTGRLWRHDGVDWRYENRPGGDHPACIYRTTAAITGWPGGQVFGGSPVLESLSDTTMFATTAGSGTAAGHRVTVNQPGRYRVALSLGVEYLPAGSTYYANMAPAFGGTAVTGKAAFWNNRGVGGATAPNSQWMDFAWNDTFWLPAGVSVALATAASPQAGQSVRYAIISVERVG